MRTAAELLEKAQAFDALAASAQNDLLRATYLDIAKNYRELAELRAERPSGSAKARAAAIGRPRKPRVPLR